MKNSLFTSRAWLIVLLLLGSLGPLSISAQPGISTERNVIFLHGLNDNNSRWQPFVNRFAGTENRWITPFNQGYSSVGGFNAIFNRVSRSGSGSSSVAICHSMGGIVARNLDSNNPGNFVGGIVTVGSPMDGAPVANAILDLRAATAISNGIITMRRGPEVGLGSSPLFSYTGRAIGSAFLPNILDIFLNASNFGGAETVNDISAGSSAMEIEKRRAPTATPKISIWGNENSPIQWNFASTATKQNVNEIANITSTIYEINYWGRMAVGWVNYWNALGWWNLWAGYEWYAGLDWVRNDSERIWNNIIGSDMVGTQCYQVPSVFCQLDANCDDMPRRWANCPRVCVPVTASVCTEVRSNGISDAYIPFSSQRGEGSNSWRVRNGATTSGSVVTIEAPGVNHFEETDANNDVMRSVFGRVFSGQDGGVFRIDKR